nr:NAD-dependent epimerase/dehydratase family protein [uncultured Flavobacterium sp.]
MNNSIVISGSSGFVGQNLFNYLAINNSIPKALKLRNPNWRLEIDSDVRTIIHLAGKAHDTKNVSVEEEYFLVNTKLTEEIFDVFLESSCRDFIYFSSVKAIADMAEGIITEKTTPNPKTPYGQSKLQAEQYLLSKKLPKGKRMFIIRPSMIHGPNNKGNLNLLYHFTSRGIPWPLGAFKNRRSFCGIDNLCFIINEIIRKEVIPSGIYNVSDDQSLSTNRLITLMAKAQNKKERILKIPKGLISSIAKLGDILFLPLNSERLRKLTENYEVSNDKIKTAIGKPLPFSSEEGFVKTFQSFNLNK